jgi:hypothetical protein
MKYIEYNIEGQSKKLEVEVSGGDIIKYLVRTSGWREEGQIRELAEIVGLIADAASIDLTKVLADKLKGKPISVRLDKPEDLL